jgi:hypothetical protein
MTNDTTTNNKNGDDAPEPDRETVPPIPPGHVRPLTDAGAVEDWFAAHGPQEVVFEYDPFAKHRMC